MISNYYSRVLVKTYMYLFWYCVGHTYFVFSRSVTMIISTCGGAYQIKTFHAKVAYFGFLVYGGIFAEGSSVSAKFKNLFVLLNVYTLSVGAGGSMLYLLYHRHDDLSLTYKIFIGLTINGVLALNAGQLLFFVYRGPMKASIQSMDNHFYTHLDRRPVKKVCDEMINVTRIIHLMAYGSFLCVGAYLVVRPVGLAILGSENMSNIFFQLSPLPLEFVEKRYGVATVYWLTYGLMALGAAHILPASAFGMVMVSVIPSTLYNNFLYLRSWIDDESRASTENFTKYESSCNYKQQKLEMENVERRYIQYIRCYQKLLGEIKLVRDYLEVIYSFLFLTTFVGSVPAGVLIITNEEIPIYTLISTGSLVIICVIYIIIFSYIGSQFEGINTKIMTSVYDSPWLHLNPRQRRTLIIFMTLLQKPIDFKVLKNRPLTMTLVVRFFQLNYTIVNFIRMKTAV